MKVGDKIKFKNDKLLKDVYEVTRISDTGIGFKGKNGWGYYDFDAKEIEVVKENKEMKELTFREVIANIKEREVYENGIIRIEHCGGQIQISRANGKKIDDYILCFSNVATFRLKRQEYSFQEAFEAFENGEEIESVENKWKWKKNGVIRLSTPYGGESFETSCDRIFSIDEIKGKWYINK